MAQLSGVVGPFALRVASFLTFEQRAAIMTRHGVSANVRMRASWGAGPHLTLSGPVAQLEAATDMALAFLGQARGGGRPQWQDDSWRRWPEQRPWQELPQHEQEQLWASWGWRQWPQQEQQQQQQDPRIAWAAAGAAPAQAAAEILQAVTPAAAEPQAVPAAAARLEAVTPAAAAPVAAAPAEVRAAPAASSSSSSSSSSSRAQKRSAQPATAGPAASAARLEAVTPAAAAPAAAPEGGLEAVPPAAAAAAPAEAAKGGATEGVLEAVTPAPAPAAEISSSSSDEIVEPRVWRQRFITVLTIGFADLRFNGHEHGLPEQVAHRLASGSPCLSVDKVIMCMVFSDRQACSSRHSGEHIEILESVRRNRAFMQVLRQVQQNIKNSA